MVKRLFIGCSYQRFRDEVQDYKPMEDMFVSTGLAGAKNKLMSMLPRGEWTYLIPDWTVGKYWLEVRDQLEYRLMRSGETLDDCQLI